MSWVSPLEIGSVTELELALHTRADVRSLGLLEGSQSCGARLGGSTWLLDNAFLNRRKGVLVGDQQDGVVGSGGLRIVAELASGHRFPVARHRAHDAHHRCQRSQIG